VTGPDVESPVREAPRELLALACAVRPDWDEAETWNAMHAAKTAGLDWTRLALRLMGIALRVETPPTRPRELWDFARGITSKAAERPPPAEHVAGAIAAIIAGDYAAAWSATHEGAVPAQIVKATGGQPALTEGNDPRAGAVPATEAETNLRR
jgi:hypothetical protein